jgi:hypothetical protein
MDPSDRSSHGTPSESFRSRGRSAAVVLILCEQHPMSFAALVGFLIWSALTFGCANKLEAPLATGEALYFENQQTFDIYRQRN